MLRRRAPISVETAACFTLVFAFGLHLALNGAGGWFWLLAASCVFAVLLLIPQLQDKTGWLTNYWIVSGLLLGLGQVLGLEAMGVASQLGASLGMASKLLTFLLVAGAAGSVVIGRRFRLPAVLLQSGAIGGAIVLMAISYALGRPAPSAVEAASTAAGSDRPNILLIVMDTVHADHLAVYGYGRDTTPNLRDLARDSMVYTEAMSASDITLTSHASLFTGMYPSWHGAYCDPQNAAYGRALSSSYPTLAELLHKAGYQTTGVAANLYLRADFGLERGFDRFHIPRPVPILAAENGFMLRHGLRRGLSFLFDTAQFDRLYAMGEDINTALFADLSDPSKTGAPVFTFVNYMDAHFPYLPPAPYDVRYPGRRWGMTQDDLEVEQKALVTGQSGAGDYGPHCISQYDGGIAYEDQQIGDLVKWLKRRGTYDNTMIVVTSDHGEAFGERKRVGHANSPYQNLLHVALLVKYPHQTRHGTEGRPVSLTDVAPTVLEAAGIGAPAAMQGRSLTAVTDREIYGETFPCPVAHPPDCPNGCTARAIYAWPYKFITSSNGRRELFDLGGDPAEHRNLYIQQPERAAQLSDRLALWMKNMPKQSHETHTLSPEDLRRLKSLGYVQ
jgi:arylsulfatase A-like enzyme